MRAHEPAAEPAHRPEEAHHELGGRLVVDLARRADLLDPAVVHHRDPVGDLHRLLLVVGDQHRGHALLVVQPAQPRAQLGADGGVERAERLVEQQHLRLDGERAGERHPLALAARELVRAAARPTSSARPAPAARRRGRGSRPWARLRIRRPKATFSRTLMCANGGVVLEHEADRRAPGAARCVTSRRRSATVPVSGGSRPAMIRSSVDLPEPLGPSSAVSEPSGTSSETSSSAREVAEALGDCVDVDPHRASFLCGARAGSSRAARPATSRRARSPRRRRR